VFVSSHLLAEVEHLADDVVVINRGRLVTSGPLHELQQEASLVRAGSPERLGRVLESAGGIVVPQGADGLIIRGLPIDEIGEQAFRAGIALHELSPHAGSLEELFLNWTSAGSGSDSSDISEEVVRL
jgi:ABC-2 type transport system ATP-binding protein